MLREAKKRKNGKHSLSIFLVVIMVTFGLCSGIPVGAEQPQYTEEKTFESKDKEATCKWSDEIVQDGLTYIFSGATQEIISEQVLYQTVEKTLEKEQFDLSEDKAKQFAPVIIEEEVEYHLSDISVKEQTLSRSFVSLIQTQKAEGSRDNLPESVTVPYTTSDGEDLEVTLPLTRVEELPDLETPETFDMTIYSPSASRLEFNGQIIANPITVPPVVGYENLYLSYLNLSSEEYSITGADWSGGVYTTSSGEEARNATIYAIRRVKQFEGTYGSNFVTLPSMEGYRAKATYTAQIEEPTGEAVYTIKSTASYLLKDEPKTSSWPMVLASVGIGVLAVAAAWVLLVLGKKRKRQQTE